MSTRIASKYIKSRQPLRRLEVAQYHRQQFQRDNPTAVRYRDILRLRGEGDFAVCRATLDNGLAVYICSNGMRTVRVARLAVLHGLVRHFRDGVEIQHTCQHRSLGNDHPAPSATGERSMVKKVVLITVLALSVPTSIGVVEWFRCAFTGQCHVTEGVTTHPVIKNKPE